MNPRLLRLLLPVLAVALLTASCRHFLEASYIPYNERKPDGASNLIDVSYELADEIHKQVNATVPHHEPLVVASFVPVNDPNRTSTLGLMLGKHVGSRLAQHDYAVMDITPRAEGFYLEEPKEGFLLSRDLGGINPSSNVSRVVVGVYGLTQNGLYVSARMVNVGNGVVLGSADRRLGILEDDPALD